MSKLRSADQRGSSSRLERLRDDRDHRIWHHPRRDPYLVGLNAVVIGACAVLYLAGHAAWQVGVLHPFLRSHAFDLLATPLLLATANVLTAISPFRSTPFAYPIPALGLTTVAVIVWEGLAPLYRTATADWADVIAYLLGAVLYLVIVRLRMNRRTLSA